MCPFAKEILDLGEIPTFLGGTCPRKINGVPNEQTKPNVPPGSDGMSTVTVLNRDTYDVFTEVPEGGGVVNWRLKIADDRGVEMSAALRVPTQQTWDENKNMGDGANAVAEVMPVMESAKLKGDGDNELTGSIDCQKGGLLVVTFSNVHSIWNTKTVRYALEVVEK